MRALTCPQCGSLIQHLLPHQPIAGCDYCGVRLSIGGQFLMPEPFAVEAAKFRALERSARPREPIQPIFIAISIIGILTLLLFVAAFFIR